MPHTGHVACLLAAVLSLRLATPPAARQAEDVGAVARRLATVVPGVQVAVWSNGRVIAEAAAGWADVARKVPVTSDTRFPVFSAAKAWTVTAAARLVEGNRLAPYAQIGELVPEFPKKEWSFTLMQLAEHKAGIRHYRDDAEAEDSRRCGSVREAVRLFENDPLLFEPGTRTGYSSWGYVLLSRIIEIGSSEPFSQTLAKLVLTPSGMTRTVPAATALGDGDTAASYRPTAAGHTSVTIDPSCKWGAGGYYSTAGDLVRFYGALTSGKLVSPPMQALILGQDADARFSFGGVSLGGQARVAGNVRAGVFVAVVVNQRNPAADLEAAAAGLRARYE